MPYPLPGTGDRADGRQRVLPPIGCPGGEEWVLPHEVRGWLELSFRLGAVPALPLELFWMPVARRWNEPLGSAAIELTIDPHGLPAQDFTIAWGDGSSELVPWTPGRPDVPKLRHVYEKREDLAVTVTMGMNIAVLQVALIGCPLPPALMIQSASSAGMGLAGIEPLVPGDGLDGQPYNGSLTEVWRLRLHPEGGLALMPSPVDGKPALVVLNGAGAGGRATRWYSGDGPPLTEALLPAPALGDLYLDRVTGQVYELVV